MAIWRSQIDTGSDAYRQNRADMLALVEGFRALEQRVRDTSNARRPVFEKRGQLSPRDRLAHLLDRGALFLEISTLCGYRMHDDDGGENIMGGGFIAGIGSIAGIRCMVTASDSGIKGGTIAPMGLRKSLRAQEIAFRNKLPVVNLVESGGANLNYQAEIFVDGGRGFANQARMSAAGIPQITVVHGSSTAGGAYIPGMSDYVVVVKGRAKIFLAGPPLLKSATGEIATDEELGGAEMHTTVSGVAEFMAEDDADGLRLAREILQRLPWNARGPQLQKKSWSAPAYDIDELCGIVPVDYRKPYDVREVMARLTDASDLTDFKALYGSHTVCAQASIEGEAVGLIGNNGPIDTEGAVKAAQFIQLCDQADMPLVFLQNTTGYMVGKEAERGGIVKHGSKMIQAVTNARVPKLTLHIGASFGAGNYGMCGRAYDPRFIFAWPNNRIAVMGPEQAAGVLGIVAEEKFRRAGAEPDMAALEKMKAKVVAKMEAESTAYFATARLWDDGLIDPRDSRRVLAMCLSVCREADARVTKQNAFGIARM
ncbi:acyl-CoA carboxylase subunit beta [Ferrovibrio sp.]|uniref:acyl-CoA carboxylase subunit beta n=1 Tax=Ferrovibrio sp. TaxID=1917215 RepID=UPI000CAA7A7A|nr:carboxyl transferase domain-containing protein [Ferrovibrio sp.]PJI39577.1 MAG: acetyl-CoA carboxylase carboxyltransferase subunit [Ferrovibrio sp.]